MGHWLSPGCPLGQFRGRRLHTDQLLRALQQLGLYTAAFYTALPTVGGRSLSLAAMWGLPVTCLQLPAFGLMTQKKWSPTP